MRELLKVVSSNYIVSFNSGRGVTLLEEVDKLQVKEGKGEVVHLVAVPQETREGQQSHFYLMQALGGKSSPGPKK